ncbi:FkbM family methyltransferase [Brevundimonas sp.]|jgi:FkbM family methyltransferase|uniref:FkbM family methyltransferase n=1 Tax=Brevundimonas sp. TaxID=1871086 RepID=UPI0037BE5197
MFESYAQNAEDVRLNRCFAGQSEGFFIDVGASEPTRHSVTYALYLQGWRGISIDPLPDRCQELDQLRPGDVNLNIALSDEPGVTNLYRSLGRGGTSTIVQAVGESMREASPDVWMFPTPVDTLTNVSRQFAPELRTYPLLKIDVEGAEEGVLRGADFSQFRPSVIVVEGQAAVPKWEKLITDQSYRYVVHDGVNRWYCCDSRNDYAELLRPPVSAVDNFRRYDQIGSPLSNSVHPEHRWAIGLSHRLICALKAVSNDVIVAAYTDKIADHLLDKPCDASIYRGATRAVLGRQPNDTEWALFEEQDKTTTIREVYELLVNSEEFLMKRGRAIASM